VHKTVGFKSLCKGFVLNITMNRPICKACNQFPAAVNYKKAGKTHYRSRCAVCINKFRKIKVPTPRWMLRGYKKRVVCDICKFRAKHGSQVQVFHIDGNLNNNELINLRSVCLNCSAIIQRQDSTWKPGDIAPDA
jgi:hypothetical protein